MYNIAALYRQAGLAESSYRRVNAVAAGELVGAAAAAGVRRVVHCSTVGVHGDIEQSAGRRRRAAPPGRRVPGHQGRRGAARTRGRGAHRHRADDREALRHLRARRPPPPEAVSGRGAAAIRRDRRRAYLLPSDVYRRSRRRLSPLWRGGCGGGTHLHPRGRRGEHAERARVPHRGRSRRAPAAGCICRSGRSGWPGPPARRSAVRSESSHRSTGAAWTSSRRAARSASTAPVASWASRRRLACERASGARSRGTRSGHGCESAIMVDEGPADQASAVGNAAGGGRRSRLRGRVA